MDASIDRGVIQDTETTAVIDSIDELHLCEACVRAAAETLGFKPQLHTDQQQKIRRLERERDHWKDTSQRLRRELDHQFDAGLGDPRARRSR